MQRLTMVAPAPGEDPMLGWPDESWDEYATASVEHIDLHPRRGSRYRNWLHRAWKRCGRRSR